MQKLKLTKNKKKLKKNPTFVSISNLYELMIEGIRHKKCSVTLINLSYVLIELFRNNWKYANNLIFVLHLNAENKDITYRQTYFLVL